jgi:deoxyribodipyrimidine photolyase-related protein
MNKALIILGDQLFPPEFYDAHKDKLIFMAEDQELCTHYKYHKHKIIFFLTSMRTYAQTLTHRGHKIYYHELNDKSFMARLQEFLVHHRIEHVTMGEINDKFFEEKILSFFKKIRIDLTLIETPMFLCSRKEFKNYLSQHAKPFMKSFYEKERKRLKVLLDEKGKPVGGQWSFDSENRKKAPKTITAKDPLPFNESPQLKEVMTLVQERFSHHPGEVESFWAATDRKDALKSLEHFISHHLSDFGAYQDAITSRSVFMYHSILSPYINAGLLTPKEVMDEVIKAYHLKKAPLSSVEGFIRQVMGWREFVRGIYQNFSEKEESLNFFNHHNKLTPHWYEGTTGLPPVDDAIQKAMDFSYCHHIERLMILSNIMLLSELHPLEVHRWFMELFIDSADWVMGPNVFGMGQFSDGGIFATKPYISGSNYVLKMSDYKKGPWCDIWDGLFWRFIGKHRAFFQKQPRLNFMVITLEKMDPVKRSYLLECAEEFISLKTVTTV